MTTNVGMNASENISMNKTTSIGLVNLLNVGADFMTNVVGKMVEFVSGNYESYSEKGIQISSQELDVQTDTDIKVNASEKLQRNSREKNIDF